MMNRLVFSRLGLAGLACLLAACSTNAKVDALERQVQAAQKKVAAYQARFGKLKDADSAIDLRDIRPALVAASKITVRARMGQPTEVFALNKRECWTYRNRVYDSLTDRAVRTVEFWFKKGKVDEILFNY